MLRAAPPHRADQEKFSDPGNRQEFGQWSISTSQKAVKFILFLRETYTTLSYCCHSRHLDARYALCINHPV